MTCQGAINQCIKELERVRMIMDSYSKLYDDIPEIKGYLLADINSLISNLVSGNDTTISRNTDEYILNIWNIYDIAKKIPFADRILAKAVLCLELNNMRNFT